MSENNNSVVLDIESKAVQLHLEFMQDIISRLSSKSSACKNWCITLTSAFILLSLRIENGNKYILLSYVPIVIFIILNVYYIYLERSFREEYNNFIDDLHIGNLKITDIYKINIAIEQLHDYKKWKSAINSPSILIFYMPLFIINFVITIFVFCG